jgi:beta-fructofuranosidase
MPPLRRVDTGQPVGDAIPFAHDGEYHLFCLSAPSASSQWLHWRSRDLAAWQQLPAAVGPSRDDAAAPDAGAAWTGSVIEHDGRFHLFYTGNNPAAATPQTICRAISDDLVSFDKDPANPLLGPDQATYAVADWRDPFVFYNADEQRFWMLIATRRAGGPRWRGGCIALATSTDLTDWTLEPEPLYQPGDTYCTECPEMFQLGDTWYLVYSRFSERAATVYRVADNPRGPWRQPDRDTLDGRRWYAAKSAPLQADADARVFFGWVHERTGETDTGDWRWGGDLTCPRIVRQTRPGQLTVSVAETALADFTLPLPLQVGAPRRIGGRSDAVVDAAVATITGLGAPGVTEYVFAEVEVPTYCLDVALWPHDCAEFGLLVGMDDDLAGHAVAFDRRRGSVSLIRWPQPVEAPWDRSFPPGTFALDVDGPRLAELPLTFTPGASIDVRLLVQGSVMEIYADRQVALSYRLYRPGPHAFGFYAEDGRVDVDGIRLNALGD